MAFMGDRLVFLGFGSKNIFIVTTELTFGGVFIYHRVGRFLALFISYLIFVSLSRQAKQYQEKESKKYCTKNGALIMLIVNCNATKTNV